MKVRTRWIERLVDRLGRQPAHTGVTSHANAAQGVPGKNQSVRLHPTENRHGHARGRRGDLNVNATNRPCDDSNLGEATHPSRHLSDRVGRGRADLRVGLISAAIVLSASSTIHAGAAADHVERFDLFNDCRPIFLLVETLPKEAAVIGLTADSLAMAARSRLRSARLYTDERSAAYLYINVNVVGAAFSATLDFNKSVYDPISALTGYATTWNAGGAGTHGKNAAYVRNVVAGYVDEFLDAFLRVNQAACANATRPNPD